MKQKIRRMLYEEKGVVSFWYRRLFNRISSDRRTTISFLGSINFRNNVISIIGNNELIFGQRTVIRDNQIYISGSDNQVRFGENVSLYGDGKSQSIYVSGNSNTIIVDDDTVLRHVCLFIWGNNNLIHIKRDCSLTMTGIHMEQDNNCCLLEQGNTTHGRMNKWVQFELDEGTTITVDEDCMISNDVVFRSSDSHSVIDFSGKRLNHAADIYVGKHCWFGMRCMVMKGVNICDHVIIGAGSICVKNISESYAIMAGSPAKIVKRQIDWDRKFIE